MQICLPTTNVLNSIKAGTFSVRGKIWLCAMPRIPVLCYSRLVSQYLLKFHLSFFVLPVPWLCFSFLCGSHVHALLALVLYLALLTFVSGTNPANQKVCNIWQLWILLLKSWKWWTILDCKMYIIDCSSLLKGVKNQVQCLLANQSFFSSFSCLT